MFQATGIYDYYLSKSHSSGNNSTANCPTNPDHHALSCPNGIKTGGDSDTDSFAKADDYSFTDLMTRWSCWANTFLKIEGTRGSYDASNACTWGSRSG